MNRNRRQFVLGLGGAALASTAGSGVFAQSARRQVTVGGREVRVVDIHAHCEFPELQSILASTNLEDVRFRDFVTLSPARIDEMNRRGIDVQVLSVNQYYWYNADRDLASQIVDVNDRGLAEWCETYPDRFVFLSSPALQFPDLAADQLQRAVEEFGARGASVGGHVDNVPPTAEFFDPFWARAESLGVPVFMHPNNAQNVVMAGSLGERHDLGNIIGNPLETTLFLTRMILDGVLDRFPNLKICGAHGGGYITSYLGRSEYACIRSDDCVNTRPVGDYFKDQIIVDSMVFSDEGIRHLVAETGPSQVVYGSDLPYTWPDTIDLIVESRHLDDATKIAILGGNLIDLLKL